MWKLKENPIYQEFLDGSWPMPSDLSKQPVYFDQCFSKEKAEQLFQQVIRSYGVKTQHYIFDQEGKNPIIREDLRDSHGLESSVFESGTVHEQIKATVERAILDYSGLKHSLRSVQIQALGYEASNKFFEHNDSHVYANGAWKLIARKEGDVRRWSSVLWLSDHSPNPRKFSDFSGGLLRFHNIINEQDQPFDIKPIAGYLAVFPAHPVFLHSVTQIQKGYRLAIAGFWDVNVPN